MKDMEKKPPTTTLAEQVVQHADGLIGQVKQLPKQLEHAELPVLLTLFGLRQTSGLGFSRQAQYQLEARQ
jgi:hypothetical protein